MGGHWGWRIYKGQLETDPDYEAFIPPCTTAPVPTPLSPVLATRGTLGTLSVGLFECVASAIIAARALSNGAFARVKLAPVLIG